MNMKTEHPAPKAPSSHLHSLNLIVAMLAGIISITGGVYSLKNNLFSGPEYGSLQGIVRDEKIAKPLKLVSVEIADLTGAVVNTVSTDDDGHYKVESLKTGNYAVKFTAPLHKVETKSIKIEKNLESSINVDLVPEIPAPTSTLSQEVVAQRLSPAYVSASNYQGTAVSTPYQVPSTVNSGYNATGNTVPYAASRTSAEPPPDESFQGPPPGSPRRHPHRYPGSYNAASSDASNNSSSGSSLATVGTQLLSAFMASKSENSTSTITN